MPTLPNYHSQPVGSLWFLDCVDRIHKVFHRVKSVWESGFGRVFASFITGFG